MNAAPSPALNTFTDVVRNTATPIEGGPLAPRSKPDSIPGDVAPVLVLPFGMSSTPAGSAPPDPHPYIMSGYLRGLFDYLKARGAAVEPVLDVMRITEAELLDPDRRVDHSLQNDIFEAAERVTGDVNVGLHAGEATHLIHFGIGGMLAMTCKTVRELVELHTRFQRLISTGATMRYERVGDEIVGEAGFLPSERLSRHTLEYTLASHLTLARLMSGVPVFLSRLEVTYPEPADCSEQQRVFGCDVRYRCEHERLYFPAAFLDVSLAVGDNGSRAALEAEARRRLDSLRNDIVDDDPDIAKLKEQVAANLQTGPSSIEEAAAALGVSVRTLQRRLEARGLSYRGLVDIVRRELAEQYIRAASLSQVDIAYLLGFSDQSAFHRAFRRWFATTPGEYRARYLQWSEAARRSRVTSRDNRSAPRSKTR